MGIRVSSQAVTREHCAMINLLAQAEGGLVGADLKALPWAQVKAFDGAKVGSLWNLSYEALEQLVSLAMAVAGNAGLAQTDQPSVEVVPAQNRGLTCLTCGIWTFESREKQATHFASDWHRANAARRVQGKPALSSTAICTAETATPKTREAEAPSSSIQVVHDDDDDDEGSEGSEEEVDDDVEGADAAIALHREERSSTVQLLLGDNLACSLSPAVLFARKFWGGRGGQALTQAVAVQAIQELCNARRLRPFRVAVVALRSGKFVAAIFEGRRMTHHKTMARYTTRRGQGGAQSTIDGSGKAPKSIGSQLRRHGERQLADDVRVLLDEWRTALNACDLITVACARVLRPVLFDSAVKSPLDPHDRRIQRLPFALHKPTLESVRQAHDRLGLFVLHEPTTRTTPRELKDKPAPQSLPEKADYGKPQGVLSIAEVVPENSESSSSLLKACEANSIQDAMALLDAAPDDLDLEARDMLGRRALHLAAQAANPHLVARLLEAGADPAALDDRDRPPYFFASDKKTRDAFRVVSTQSIYSLIDDPMS